MPSLLKFPHNAFALMNVASAADRNEARREGSIHSYMWVVGGASRSESNATLHTNTPKCSSFLYV